MPRIKVPVICVPDGTKPVDLDGVLYQTTRYPHFQRALHNIDEGLHLAFDRSIARWVIYRDGWEVRRLDAGEDLGGVLGYRHNVPSIVYDICWAVDTPYFGGWKVINHYREPSESVLCHIGRICKQERERLAWDNSGWANKAVLKVGEDSEARAHKAHEELSEAVWSDIRSSMDPNSSTPVFKPQVSVPRAI